MVKSTSAGWRTIGGKRIYFRSEWEVHYAMYLEFMLQKGIIKAWEHEPQTFWFLEIKRGVRSYLPDFKITQPDGSHYWVEVKGYMDSKSITKIKRLRKYYPEEKIYIADKAWFAKNLTTKLEVSYVDTAKRKYSVKSRKCLSD